MKSFITSFIIVFILGNGFTQSFDNYRKNWATYFGGQGTSFISSVVDSQGNVIAIGQVSSLTSIITDANYYNQFATNTNFLYSTTLPANTNSNQLLIVKFSPNGVLLASGYLPFQPYRMKIDSFDNLYIIGITNLDTLATNGSWQTTSNNSTNKIVLSKLNPDFSTNWCTYLPTISCNDFCFDENQNIYGVGYTTINNSITTPNVFQPNFITEYNSLNQVYDNGYAFKLNNSGQLQWATYFGVSTQSFAIAYLNNEIITSFTKNNHNSLQAYDDYYYTENAYQQTPSRQVITKFNAVTGQRTYGTYLGNDEDLTITHIACDTENYYFLGTVMEALSSSYISSNAYQSNYGGFFDVYLGKFNTNINPIWGTYIGGSDIDEPHIQGNFSVIRNSLYFSGATFGSNFINSPNPYQNNNAGDSDVFMMKFSSDGSFVWGSCFGGTSQEIYGSISPVNDDTFYLVGNTRSTQNIATTGSHQASLNFHPSYPSSNFGNGFIAKFAPQEDLSALEIEKNSFAIYPNPAQEQLTIAGQLTEGSKIEIINMLGQIVLQTTITNNIYSHTINLNAFSKGTYVLRIINHNKNTFNHKIIVE